MEFVANYPERPNGYKTGGISADFDDEDLFLNYLLSEGVITESQHRGYYLDIDFNVYLDGHCPRHRQVAEN